MKNLSFMAKLFMDIREFLNASEMHNSLIIWTTGLLTAIQLIIQEILFHQCMLILTALIVLDTIFGVLRAIEEKKFKWSFAAKTSLTKLLNYITLSCVCWLVGLAPSKSLVTPLISLVFTYTILREAASVLRTSAILFKNQGLENIALMFSSLSNKIFRRKI